MNCVASEEERRQLEGLWRTGRSHRVRERAHAVLLSARSYTLDRMADGLEVDRDAVSRTLDRWERGGVAALEEDPRPGQRPKVDAALEAEVLACAAEQPASLRRTLAKRGARLRLLRHVEKGAAPGALALAAHASAPGQAARPAPGAGRMQGLGQAARPRAGRAV